MPDASDIIRQIGHLAKDLDRIVAEERAAAATAAESQLAALTAELDRVRAGEEQTLTTCRELEQEAKTAAERIETLTRTLKEARQAADEAQILLHQQLATLREERDAIKAALEDERTIRKQQGETAAPVEQHLGERDTVSAGAPETGTAGGITHEEISRLQGELDAALASGRKERRARERAEDELAEAHKLIEALETAVRQSRSAAKAPPASTEGAAERLRAVELELAEVRRAADKSAADHAGAQQRIAELERTLQSGTRPPDHGDMVETVVKAARPASEKPLPHELRPPPKPEARFHPDWDLQSLPCKSADQVLQAWNSVSNVQLSLEGYPSQYCAVFLVVLKQGRSKQLYLVFSLKKSRHTLLCIPNRQPANDAELDKVITEGLRYLQMSGFELEEINRNDISSLLGSYFLAGLSPQGR